MSARRLAARVLVRVFKEGAYAAPALSAELDRSPLSSRDCALATELAYGVLRTESYLFEQLKRFGKIKASDRVLVAHLLVAAYQIEFLDKIPDRAAVSEAVKLVRETHGRKVAGFCNAVLRRFAEREDKTTVEEACFVGAPPWLKRRLIAEVGEADARALFAGERARTVHLRITCEAISDELSEWLEGHTEPVVGLPRAYRYVAGGDPRKNEWYGRGLVVVQELGAQLVAHALGVRPGDSVLDVCAGRGQKTTLLAQQAGSGGRVLGTDVFEHKVRAQQEEAARVGYEVESYVWDWTRPAPDQLRGAFDRVLVDAPCSGVGTLGRRPEIARRLTESDPARLGELQLAILVNAAECLKPGGSLVFATCSVLAEEGPEVVKAAETVGLRPAVVDESRLPEWIESKGETLRLSPSRSGTDGYFIARLEK